MSTRTTLMLVTSLLAVATFAAVQDRVTAAGARRYAAAVRTAVADRRPPPPAEDLMAPAIRRSVQWGAVSGGVVLIVGFGAASLVRRR